jgi:hypothetical protein
MNEVSASGAQYGYSARPFYSASDIAAKDAAETASFAGQRAKEASFREAHAAGVKITLSEEAVTRVLSGTDIPAGGSDPASQYQAIAALHDQLISRTPASSIDLAHPLFSDGSTETQLTDFRTFFTAQKDRSAQATAELQDALYDAVRHQTAKTDSSDAAEIGLIREKLNVLNTRYVDKAHQADAAMEIDKYINRLVESRDGQIRTMANADIAIGVSLKDEGRIKEGQQRLEDLANGQDRTQQEMQQVFAITTQSGSATEMVERLSDWYNQLDHRSETQDQQFSSLVTNWQQFLQQYGS